MQRTIAALPGVSRRRPQPVRVLVEIRNGRGDAVVFAVANRIVGFASPDDAGHLRTLLSASDSGRLVTDGQLRVHEGIVRLWAGPPPAGAAAWPPAPPEQLSAPEPTIFGVPLNRK